MSKQSLPRACGPLFSVERCEAGLTSALHAWAALQELQSADSCKMVTPGRLAAAIDASQRLTSNTLHAVRELSVVYSRFSIAGHFPDAIKRSLPPCGELSFKELGKRIQAFSKQKPLKRIVRRAGGSEEIWEQFAHELAKVDASVGLGKGGLEIHEPEQSKRKLAFASQTPTLNAAAVAYPSARELFAHASSAELERLVATPLSPGPRSKPDPSFDDQVIAGMWATVHGMRQRQRELEDVGFVMAKGGDGGVGAVIVTIGWIITLIGLAVGLAGAIILGLCAGGTISDPTTCDVGEALAVAGAIAIGVGLGTAVTGSFIERGGTVTFGVDVDGRTVWEETIDVPPAGP